MKISPSTMKLLLDDTGYTAVKVQSEAEFISSECGGNHSKYARMLDITRSKLKNRIKRDRRVIEINGQRLAILVEATL